MHNYLVGILETLGIDIAWMEYEGDSDEYIVFSIYDDKESDFFDNTNLSETYYITINYYFKSLKNIDKWEKIRDLLKENGFAYDGGEDLKTKNIYGKNMDFIYKKTTS
ncbi:Uncharacterised protein [[Clostridium] sordellii]|uniref:Uncharacterized protein n=1 Tax=Paraclostridium sordellii TaxID=1505 RepID=A0ABM9RQ98_PARSO|nr:hypothetical protein [Paeniclostridium sordellii]EPZ54715.1 hypothetical protein H477_3855 [[Clostridium] sordellii ATCC 9714] [Paeniclostridium sordellii ATCC 9714]TAN66619.1 hypothetical protein WS9_009915 [Paeniclostridium sordellii 8483]CEJ74229.1 hypothetical protein ATCC9714_21171 [[Clostridium] sordellii] [Paeniclostridium sordellii]CEN69771.1 Uncharacterised protein [[Clostridium] sordellii] [Paeniclostridium sordellii]CEN73039.1 Uncharacterised protein [[Clostridium] sordellii] [Pa